VNFKIFVAVLSPRDESSGRTGRIRRLLLSPAALSPSLTKGDLAGIHGDRLQCGLAFHATPARVLEELAKDKKGYVPSWVAQNPSTPKCAYQ
jgi:hypothetical protein